LDLSTGSAIEDFILRCVYLLGHTIGSALLDVLLPFVIATAAAGVVLVLVWARLGLRRRRPSP
jgi:p-aminobenzoyl-glutamate transporter AbgT